MTIQGKPLPHVAASTVETWHRPVNVLLPPSSHQQRVNGAWMRGLPSTLPQGSPQPNAASVPAELHAVTKSTDRGATDDMPPWGTLHVLGEASTHAHP